MEQPFDFTHYCWRFPDFKTRALTLSYDDGRDFDRQMIEILDRYGIRGTFNLNSRSLGDSKHVAPEELNTLYKNHEVAVHSLSHPHLEDIPVAQVTYQLIADRKNLEDICCRPIEGMAYPFGLRESPGLVDAIAACGIRYARTTSATKKLQLPRDYLRWHPTCKFDDPQLDDLIQQFYEPIRPKYTPKLLYIWGHSYEYEGRWDHLETMCQKLAGHNDIIWYATNGEIIDYLEALRSLRPTVDGKYVYNPSSTRLYVYVPSNDKNIILEPGTTTML